VGRTRAGKAAAAGLRAGSQGPVAGPPASMWTPPKPSDVVTKAPARRVGLSLKPPRVQTPTPHPIRRDHRTRRGALLSPCPLSRSGPSPCVRGALLAGDTGFGAVGRQRFLFLPPDGWIVIMRTEARPTINRVGGDHHRQILPTPVNRPDWSCERLLCSDLIL
jgi:hypothetical protein